MAGATVRWTRRSARMVASVPSGDSRPRANGTGCSTKPSASMAARAIDHARRDMDLEAGVARRARHRQAMRQEIPVLGDDVEQAQSGASAGVKGVPQAAPARSRSWICTMPTGRPASTTNNAVIFMELSSSSVSLTS